MAVKTITVLGAGYVGLTTASLLAHSGYKVYVVEPNPERLNTIKLGKSFFYEIGLDPVIKSAHESGNFVPTNSYEESVPNSDVVISCVGTPDKPDGSSDLSFVLSAAQTASKLMRPGSIFVQKSTVPVGTGSKIESEFKVSGFSIFYVSNPEFLREGTALQDTLVFDRVVVGGADATAVDTIIDIYKELERHRADILTIAGINQSSHQGEYIRTGLASAELIKVTANAFLALKISFANSIAKLADKSGADIVEVMNAVGADSRINRAFLNAGRGYGGGCFPKDVSGLIASGLDYNIDLDIIRSTQAVNNSMPIYLIEKLTTAMHGSLSGKRITVLGLSFKAGTSDVRKSPGIQLANLLAGQGAVVTAYDPKAIKESEHEVVSDVQLTNELNDSLEHAEAIVVATEWPEFTSLTPSKLLSLTSARIVMDGVNALPKSDYQAAGFTYLGVGR